MYVKSTGVICICLLGLVSGGTYSNPTCSNGRHTIVHLFEWKWTDIAAECERFLGPAGYCGVQISPPSENAVITNPNRPWYERYQPISYKLETRSGNEAQLKDMVQRCNRANVRIYADAVINHMSGAGGSGTGTGGTHWDSGSLSFPGVPFSAWDFNGEECPSGDGNIHDYNNPNEVRNCRLVSLVDLKMGKDYVRDKVAEYMNKLIDIGVGGFRIDAAKHMWPGDISAVYNKLHHLRSDTFGSNVRPFIYQEVIDMGGEAISASEYTSIGRVTNFIFGIKLADVFRHSNPAKYLHNWGAAWGMPSSDDVVVFLDDHDNQRGHGGGGGVLTHWDATPYKMATAFMLAHPYGFTRVMSSYNYNRANNWEGPPHNGDMSTASVSINNQGTCDGGWACEHRWRQIKNMVAFRNVVMGANLQNWWDNGDYQIAFSRGNKGFIVIAVDGSHLNKNFNTGLPQGTYCDVISGDYTGGHCTGTQIHVGGDGRANFNINGNGDTMIAIHIGAKVGSQARVIT